MRKPIVPHVLTTLAAAGLLVGLAACSGITGSTYLPSAVDRSTESGRALPGPLPTPTPAPAATNAPPQHHPLSGRALPGPSPSPLPATSAAPGHHHL